jgi:hypothetical protein
MQTYGAKLGLASDLNAVDGYFYFIEGWHMHGTTFLLCHGDVGITYNRDICILPNHVRIQLAYR